MSGMTGMDYVWLGGIVLVTFGASQVFGWPLAILLLALACFGAAVRTRRDNE